MNEARARHGTANSNAAKGCAAPAGGASPGRARLADSLGAVATRYRDSFRAPNFRRVAGLALGAALTANAVRWLPGLPSVDDLIAATVPLSTLAAAFGWQLVSAYFHLAITAAMVDGGGTARSAGAALAVALRRTPAMLGVLAAVLATIAGGVLLAAATVAVGLLLAAPRLLYPGGLEMMIFGALVLILALPLVTVLVYWYFAFFLVVTERLSATAALGRSFALVRGQLWRMKLALSAVFFVSLVVLSLAEALGAALGALTGLGSGTLAAPFGVLGSALVAPLVVAASLALLQDLEQREGG